ncbi:MAG: glutaredoxin family protein [Desulfobacterales bacterium]|nr:glutaredoxin family protein [Desulfobacterales bacterium]
MKVMLYTLSTCSHCKSTKQLMNDCQVVYEFIDVDLLSKEERNTIIENIKQINPRCSFPTILIGDQVIVGYKQDEIKKALGL